MLINELTKGIIKDNPLFVQLLGTCPSLATTSSLTNALGMGAAFTFVLIGSNIVISLIRKLIPDQVHIPCYIVVIASLVTVVEMIMNAYVPALYAALGVFVPLIVVNCIVLGRAEAFACKNGVVASILDAIGMGIGYTLALTIIASFRELLGSGKLLGHQILGAPFTPALIFILPAGAFITMGCVFAMVAYLRQRGAAHNG
ncbi:MAG: electron transport complex subunit E [Acidaminococcaceae bacterium]|jgi:electron transport complex protein RnfE|nr:electron transport complex subunit E [Acidaminococcaceae bacterium]MCI2109353.1 electron transport complex subunit E [Acidaminococcaceae bacterium]